MPIKDKLLKGFLVLIILVNVFFLVWYLLHGDIFFHTDIARDFLLLDDLAKRKLVLIGPRSSGPGGFYHGPLWMYLNYPAFLLGNGNPIVVGWFWVLLFVAFLASSYYVAKRMFNGKVALIFVTLLSLFPGIPYIQHGEMNGFYNPFGAMFLMPLFFYFITLYVKQKKAVFLTMALLINGLMFQFQVAFGGPLLLLTSSIALYLIVREKKWLHLTSFFILLIPFSTYIAFDLRHNFSHMNAILNINNKPDAVYIPIIERLKQRWGMLNTTGLHFFREPNETFNLPFAYVVAFGIYFALKSKKTSNKIPYIVGLIIYIGYFLLSCIHNGWLMYYYWMPIYPLVFLVFSSLESLLNKIIFYSLLFVCLLSNIFMSFYHMGESNSFIGKNDSSWKFQSSLAQTVFNDAKGKEFGFFIYTPDIFAYSTKYPFVYHERKNPQTKMYIYERKPLTYLIIAPPPKEKPWMTGNWWKENKIGIRKKPDKVFPFENGYVIERYQLTEKDMKIPTDQNLNDWIYFR